MMKSKKQKNASKTHYWSILIKFTDFQANDIIPQGEGRNEIDAEALWEDALKVLKQRYVRACVHSSTDT